MSIETRSTLVMFRQSDLEQAQALFIQEQAKENVEETSPDEGKDETPTKEKRKSTSHQQSGL